MFIYRHEGNRPFRIETFLSAARSMDATKRKNSQKRGYTPTVDILFM